MMMGEWLSASRHARLITDSQQLVLWSNANFQQLLSEDTGIRLERDHMVLTDRKAQAALTRFVQCTDDDHIAIRFGAMASGSDHVIQCRRLKSGPNGDAFGIRIICAHDGIEADFRDFGKSLQLTVQEAYICRQILEGKTVNEIADLCRKSRETIRFHVKNVYQKMGVSSREAFFVKMRVFLFD